MTQIRDTRWNRGPSEVSGTLPPGLVGYEGIAMLRATADPTVPHEWLLLIRDPQLTKKRYLELQGFDLQLRTVAFETEAGPVGVLMFGLFPPEATQPAYIYPLHYGPANLAANESGLEALANQSHWHMLIMGRGKKTVDVVELENHFALDEHLQRLRDLVQGPAGDLHEAIAHLRSEYSLRDLWEKPELDAAGPLPAHVLDELEAGLVLQFVVERQEIEARDVTRVLDVLRQLRVATVNGRYAMGTVDLSIHAYEDDPRPLYQIPEVRMWLEDLVSDTPDLLFFATRTSKLPRLALLSAIGTKVLASGEIGFDGAEADRFLRRQIAGMNRLMSRAGIDPGSPAALDHFAAVIGNFKNLQDT